MCATAQLTLIAALMFWDWDTIEPPASYLQTLRDALPKLERLLLLATPTVRRAFTI